MEQQQSPLATAQKPDCIIVNLELQLVVAGNAVPASNIVEVIAPTAGAVLHQDHHVIVDMDRLVAANNIIAKGNHSVEVIKPPKGHHGGVEVVKPKDRQHGVEVFQPKGVDRSTGNQNRCVACGEPMRWVAIGMCGHRGVCDKCMIRERFWKQNKRCYICNIHTPKVLVAKVDDSVAIVGAAATTPPKLPRFAFRDGRVGNYWYHGHTTAYFEEEKVYQAARAECDGIIPRFYQPLVFFIFWFAPVTFGGAMIGIRYASEVKNLTSKIGVFVLSVFVALLLATIIYTALRCCKYEPDDLEHWRFVRDNLEPDWRC